MLLTTSHYKLISATTISADIKRRKWLGKRFGCRKAKDKSREYTELHSMTNRLHAVRMLVIKLTQKKSPFHKSIPKVDLAT